MSGGSGALQMPHISIRATFSCADRSPTLRISNESRVHIQQADALEFKSTGVKLPCRTYKRPRKRGSRSLKSPDVKTVI